jgi:hypothetical protein
MENQQHDETEKTVRGSGFTYDENKDNTDKSVPIEQAEQDEIIELPNLGEPDRK